MEFDFAVVVGGHLPFPSFYSLSIFILGLFGVWRGGMGGGGGGEGKRVVRVRLMIVDAEIVNFTIASIHLCLRH